MTFGIAPFATAPFSAGTVAGDDATITLTGSSLNITLSNSYTVQKTHFVSGFDLTSDTGTLTPKLAPKCPPFSDTISTMYCLTSLLICFN